MVITTAPTIPPGAPALLHPFYWRLKHDFGGGKLIPPDALDSMPGNPTLVDVLRRLPGARIIHSGASMQDFLATGALPGPHALDHAPQPCYAQIFLNGVQLYVRGRGEPPNLNDFDLADIAALEYYPSPGGTPIQFRTMSSDCGTLVLWSRFAPAR
jgi:hypothetical protein